MRTITFTLLLFTLCTACQSEFTRQKPKQPQADFSVQTEATDLQYENLRLLPIIAEAEFITQNAGAAELLTLPEALAQPRFRITEKNLLDVATTSKP